MKTILLLTASNVFMTLAWYGHLKLKFLEGKSLFVVILVSWGIAFFEYCLMVPANRQGYLSGEFSGYQLKIIQEAITLTVFALFAWFVLNPSSAVGAGSENSFRGERFFQRGGLRGKLIFWSDVVPNTPL